MESKIKILLLTYEFPPYTATGGIASYSYHLAKLLYNTGFDVTVFSARSAKVKEEERIYEGYHHYTIESESIDEFKTKVTLFFDKYIKSNDCDIIECPEVGAYGLEIKKKYPHIPLIVKMHTPGVLINKISRYYQPWHVKLRYVLGSLLRGKFDAGYWAKKDKNQLSDKEYLICEIANKVICPSLALKKWAVTFWGIDEKKIDLVPNPFSLNNNLFSLALIDRPQQISFVGKLSTLKGMRSLSKAIPIILDKNKNFIINLVGRDEIENGESIQVFLEQNLLKYKARVNFTGALKFDELNKIYASSRVCIFPSLWENYPTVVLESMASGAVVAAASVGGIPEMIEENVTGVLFNPHKPKEIARKVNALLSNENTRINIAINARKYLNEMINDPDKLNTITSVYSMEKF